MVLKADHVAELGELGGHRAGPDQARTAQEDLAVVQRVGVVVAG